MALRFGGIGIGYVSGYIGLGAVITAVSAALQIYQIINDRKSIGHISGNSYDDLLQKEIKERSDHIVIK